MIFRPAGRFLTRPFPPGPFAARCFAAVILPPLLFFAIMSPFGCCVLMFIFAQHTTPPGGRWAMGCNPTVAPGYQPPSASGRPIGSPDDPDFFPWSRTWPRMVDGVPPPPPAGRKLRKRDAPADFPPAQGARTPLRRRNECRVGRCRNIWFRPAAPSGRPGSHPHTG